jgi:hypothetical protein
MMPKAAVAMITTAWAAAWEAWAEWVAWAVECQAWAEWVASSRLRFRAPVFQRRITNNQKTNKPTKLN